jgi:hypothetical protein
MAAGFRSIFGAWLGGISAGESTPTVRVVYAWRTSDGVYAVRTGGV